MIEYVALIPAAGVGARAQLKLAKQFNLVGKKTIIEFAIDPFLKDENCKTCIKSAYANMSALHNPLHVAYELSQSR